MKRLHSAEFSMKRLHLHLMNHGNGNEHMQRNSQQREQSVRSTVHCIMFAANGTNEPA
jgi:hypothetical protein